MGNVASETCSVATPIASIFWETGLGLGLDKDAARLCQASNLSEAGVYPNMTRNPFEMLI